MAFFGRNKGGDYRDDEERRPNKNIPTRAFKDLNPENKKKRREPTKPWGKHERVFVLFILLATVILSGFLAVSSRNFRLLKLKNLGFSFSFFSLKDDTIVIEGKKFDKESAAKIKSLFEAETKNVSGSYGLYVIRLLDGTNYGINQNEVLQGASLLKLPLMAALYKEIDKGNISLDTQYSLRDSDKVDGSGSLVGMPAGTIVTYKDLVMLMGKESDRTAYKIVKDILGDEKVSNLVSEVGMKNTSLATGETTPRDIGIFLQRLWEGKIVSQKSRDEIFGYLTDTIYESLIPSAIPSDIKVAHKYGKDDGVVNDAGIVFTQKPFVLVIMSEDTVEDEADKVIPRLAKAVYEIEVGTR